MTSKANNQCEGFISPSSLHLIYILSTSPVPLLQPSASATHHHVPVRSPVHRHVQVHSRAARGARHVPRVWRQQTQDIHAIYHGVRPAAVLASTLIDLRPGELTRRRTWLDALCLGLLLVLFGVWVKEARPTERRVNRLLVVSSLSSTLVQSRLRPVMNMVHADTRQYWLMVATCGFTAVVHGQVMSLFGYSFGQYRMVFDNTCESRSF